MKDNLEKWIRAASGNLIVRHYDEPNYGFEERVKDLCLAFPEVTEKYIRESLNKNTGH